MAKRIKVTIHDFATLKENLNNPEELALYEAANGNTYDAEIEHDGYAVIDVTEDDYIELARCCIAASTRQARKCSRRNRCRSKSSSW